ncbi:uncharacterized protein LOC117167268 [Belonocnema kinseyi]|uniref:uncharacterized protein LOC117167268 n=1 Tax=Belonocnema kinseyi TaxID=2817044 RepID=UPI00143D1765|nr:uncharacterized protein LOC117167268 [Belonocnema kinseyi]
MDLLSRSPGAWDTAIYEILMPPEAWQTAYVLQLLNYIGDGINGDDCGLHSRRIPWTKNSYHDEFFGEARAALKKMQFVDRETKKRSQTNALCLPNLIDTLQGFRMLWKKLQGLAFKRFCTRNLNYCMYRFTTARIK